MSVFKQFTNNDIILSVFGANKRIYYKGSDIISSETGIDFHIGKNLALNDYSLNETGYLNQYPVKSVYNNIKQLYYSNYHSSSTGDNIPLPEIVVGSDEEGTRYIGDYNAPRFDNYLQTDILYNRYFPTQSNSTISVISIPSKLYGENIVPQTFNFTTEVISGGNVNKYNVNDDGEGNLILGGNIVGNIFYSHGICTFTTGALSTISSDLYIPNTSITYSSSIHIYENQFKCNIKENELELSMNPSLLSGSTDEDYYPFVTGSFFTPYVTTVGLYNNKQELLAVGKLSFPLPLSTTTDTTIVVSYDI